MAERATAQQETTLRDFVNVVFRRKWVILGIVVMASFLVFFLNARRPNFYVSSSKILVSRGEQTNLLFGQVRLLSWSEEVSSHIEVILSETVFNKAREFFADSLRIAGYPKHWKYRSGAVRADVIGESNAFYVSYADVAPDACQLGCAVTTLAFQEYYRKRGQPPELNDFFADEITTVREELDAWRGRRQSFLSNQNFYGTGETSSFLLHKIGTLEAKLVTLNGEVSTQALRVDNLDRLRRKTGEELERELAFSTPNLALQTSVVQRIKDALQDLNMKREDLEQKFTDKYPEVVSLRNQIKLLHDDLERQVGNAYQVEEETLDGMIARRRMLEDEIASARAELNTIPDKDRTIAEINDMILKLERKHELLLRKESESDVALASRPDWEVSVLSPASPPSATKRSDYVRLLLGPFLAVIVGLGLAFFMESADHSIKSGAEVEEYLEVPVLATISEVKKREIA